jgi:hypothetical protein
LVKNMIIHALIGRRLPKSTIEPADFGKRRPRRRVICNGFYQNHKDRTRVLVKSILIISVD